MALAVLALILTPIIIKVIQNKNSTCKFENIQNDMLVLLLRLSIYNQRQGDISNSNDSLSLILSIDILTIYRLLVVSPTAFFEEEDTLSIGYSL